MTQTRHHIHLIGFNHNTMGLPQRERYFMDHPVFGRTVASLRESYAVREYFLIATCNRLELVLVASRKLGDEEMLDFFSDLQELGGKKVSPAERRHLAAQTYRHYQKQAIDQLFAVACGLDSLVLGETQITGQFKKAMQFAKQEGWLGPVLDRLTQEALATAGKVRTFTEISKKTVSISHMAIHLAQRVAGDLAQHELALVGAGEMSALAARYLVRYPPRDLVILNRTVSRAQAIINETGMGRAAGLDELPDVLTRCNILLCSSAKNGCLITHQMVSAAMAGRGGRPLFLIDISLPRNIDATVAGLDDVYLFDIDDIKQIVAAHAAERALAAEKARGIVVDSSLAFLRWMNAQGSTVALASFRGYIDQVIHHEWQKSLSKQARGALLQEHAEDILVLLSAIASRLTTQVARSVNNPPAGYYREQLAGALKVLFSGEEPPVTQGVLPHDDIPDDSSCH